MMQRWVARAVALVSIAGSALLAYAAVGNGDVVATSPLTVVTVTSPTGGSSGTATLQNNTTSTSYPVLIGADATCDPEVTFTVAGGNPINSFAAGTSRDITIGCPARDNDAMKRCLLHATNNSNGAPLVDFMGLCLYGASPPSLTPMQTTVDFASVTVGDFVERTIAIRNDGTGAPIRRVYLSTSDIAGDFQFSTPCNPDASYCAIDLTSTVAPGSSFSVGLKCRPQSPGMHTAQVYVGTDTFQLLDLGVTLQCVGTATTQPALAMNPTTITIPSPVEVKLGSATTAVHLANAGGGTLLIKDLRIVDVDAGAADDWTYEAAGDCSGQITTDCKLESGEQVDIALTFDPSQIGSRHAALLVSYRDTLDRTIEVPLDAVGLGATLRRAFAQSPLAFGMVPVGRSAALGVTLVNDGNRDTMATVVLDASTTPPFTTTPATTFTVSPGAPRTLTLVCAPAAAGMFTTTATITTADTMSPVTVTATCTGSTQPLYSDPTSLQLGEIRINATAPTISVLLSTTPGTPLTVVGQPTLEAPNAAVTIGPLSQTTTPATFDVTIAPQTAGSVTATILVATSDGETLRIPVVALAVEATYIAADTLDLGTFCVDQPTTSSNLTLLSTGTATIELIAPTLAMSPSPFELSYTAPQIYPHLLAPAKAAVVAVTPHRQRTATTVADTLTWHTDVAGAVTTATSLTARFIDTGAAIAPPALNFGEVTVHLFTVDGQRIVIQNCNATPLVLDPPNIRTPFSIDSPGFPMMLSPNESVAFSVGFHPTRVGTVMETLRITSPQLPGDPLEVTLVGTGAEPEPAADAGPGPSPHGDTSFYACSCNSSNRPLGVLPIALAFLVMLLPRRRTGLR